MRRLPEAAPRSYSFLLSSVLLSIAVIASGCAPVRHEPADTPSASPTTPAQEAPPPSQEAVDQALLAARAHEAAGERALGEGEAAKAKDEFESALSTMEGVAASPGVDGARSEVEGRIAALPGDEGAGEPVEVDADEPTEPSPLDELSTASPQLSPSQAEQERSLIEPARLEFDIPMVVNEKVLAWVDFYTNAHREKFREGLVRSGRYLAMIQRIFTEEGLPKDLAYMAHVESAYKPNAYSRARAKGIFQFIVGTGRRYGLRTDTWIDERSDPEKATRAAAAYLKDLYGMFGDWFLALAAYNAGEGKIQRVVAATGERDFWTLAGRRRLLRNETANYVPAILAATLISKDPGRFGLSFTPDPPVAYDEVEVAGAVSLRVLARCAGSDFETLKGLNPSLRRRQTPPGATTTVRVPAGAGPATLAALQELPAGDRVLLARHRVEKGETLAAIARSYGVTTGSIRRQNRMGKRTVVRPGELLAIPDAPPSASAAGAEERAAPDATGAVIVRVRSGDTLAAIARRYGTTPAAIASLNGIGLAKVLHVGDRLKVAQGKGVIARSTSRAAAPRRVEPSRVVHTVRRGETLARIADKYRISLDDLCTLNNISRNETLYPGTRLTVSGE